MSVSSLGSFGKASSSSIVPSPSESTATLYAAKAEGLEYIILTPLDNSEATLLESPPLVLLPQVTTEPSSLSAAKAESLEYIVVTPLDNLEATLLESPPVVLLPQVKTIPS